ncbi:MAG: nitrite reductase small subunit NirD [Gammaproteobacteria bacterium]|nr:nitrite reductase small subunit NirD [Gammaproteobacteria bacterium]MCK5091176.1 nitrite reductase small subunit NirD [Gammaproteobacteria bacterium]
MNENWIEVGSVDDVPVQGARVVKTEGGDIAIFRTEKDEIFALRDKCPHKGGPLSQGFVHGKKVACPMHNWNINLDSGIAVAPDEGCAARYPIMIKDGNILLSLTPDEGASDN